MFWEIAIATIEDLAIGIRSSRASRKGDSPLFSSAMKKRGLSPFLIGEDV
jgi:hypothetical protein